ncbi:MAG: hypothetical protein ACHREM_16905 [Polyangiales bacterium]
MANDKTQGAVAFPQLFADPLGVAAWWQKAWLDGIERMTGASAQVQGYEQRAIDQATAAVDEMARLTKATLAYSAEISQGARGSFLDTARKLADQAAPKAG